MKNWRNTLSFLLVLVIVVQLLPLSSLAIELEMPKLPEQTEEPPPAVEAESNDNSLSKNETTPYVIGEVEDRREETAKHFRMSDGSFIAVQYDTPVHYQDAAGTWQEIDNSLTLQNGRYITQNGAVTKSFAATMADEELVRINFGEYTLGIAYVVPDASKDPNQPSESIVSQSPDEESKGYDTNNATDSMESVEVEDGSEDQLDLEDSTDKTDNASGSEVTYVTRQDASVKASVENYPKASTTNKSVPDVIAQETYPSKVQYANADNNIDLVYENHGNNIKESILIHGRQEQYKYAFLLDSQGLAPALHDDGSIALKSNDGDVIFSIPAPKLEDANGVPSDTAKYQIEMIADQWLLTVEADASWMNDDSRAFPVILDPSIIINPSDGIITSRYVRSLFPNATTADQQMLCGYHSSYGECRIVLRISSLPTIPSDCVLAKVFVEMYHAAYYGSSYAGSPAPNTEMLVQARATSASIPNVATQTWNTLLPITSGKILDYKAISNSTCSKNVRWDITSAAANWYTNGSTNCGLVFEAPHAQAEGQLANISGSGFISYGPKLIVQYHSAVGLETYYSYQQAGAGRAGVVYISDYTNQLTVLHPDVSFSSVATPFTLCHVYNSEHANQQFSSTSGINTCDFSSMVIGSGWKLSAQQTVVSKVIGNTAYLIYNDEDGTEHYFQQTAYNTYEDEEGQNLKMVKSGVTYTMTNEDANHTWTFYNGYLISERDVVGNMVYYAYNSNYNASSNAWKPTAGSGNKLVQIVSVPVGQSPTTICTFGYTGAFLTSIGDYAGRIQTFTINGENGRNILKYMRSPDQERACYEYDAGTGWMKLLYDTEAKYGLEITQRTCQGVKTVDRVREFTSPSVSGTRTYGGGFHAYRNGMSLTSYRFYGADHIADGILGGDDIILYNALDHWGRTICAYETDSSKSILLGVTAEEYTANSETSKTNNRLNSVSVLGMLAENMIEDGGVELDNSRFWEPSGTSSTASATFIQDEDTARTGKGALCCTLSETPPTGQPVSFYQEFNLQQGKTYVFSGYINTDFSSDSSSASGAYLEVSTTLGMPLEKSEVINYSTYSSQSGDDIDNYNAGWEKVSVSFTPSSSAKYRLSFVLCDVEGTAYADDFQLECRSAASIQNDDIGASSTNLLHNGSFEGDYIGVLYDWNGDSFSFENSSFLLGPSAAGTSGDPFVQSRLSQTVPINRSAAGLTFVLSGWGKAESVGSAVPEPKNATDPYFGLIATIQYDDDTTEDHYVSFSPDYTDWQYASGNIVPQKPKSDNGEYKKVTSITVSCAYDYNANDAFFDNISLVQEPVQTYSYDDDGNLLSATDGNAQSLVEYYDGTHRPSLYTTLSGIRHTLTYTSNKLLETDTIGNYTTTNTYDSVGNISAQTIGSSQTTAYLQSNSAYSADQHFLTSYVNENGIASTFTFNSARMPLTTQVGGDATQGYGYFPNTDRMQQTYISGKASIFYTFGNAALTQLQRKSFNGSSAFYQRYNMTNDSFGNTTSVSVSGSTNGTSFSSPITLYNYTFESGVNNGRCVSKTYPNGDTVSYSYDLFDRITEENYTGTVTSSHTRRYDGEGNLAERTATTGNQTELRVYQYDGLGRLFHKRLSFNGVQTLSTSYYYDTANRLKREDWSTTGSNYSKVYSYDATYGSLTSTSTSVKVGTTNFDLSQTFAYTPLQQLQTRTTAGAYYQQIAYRTNPTTHRTTMQVSSSNYHMPSGVLSIGYQYTYDTSGKISRVERTDDSSDYQTYTYDVMGQLTSVNDSGSGKSYSYSYDTAGNIRTATEDGVTTTYTYGNTAWPDLLTKVKVGSTEKTIHYTTPGLPDDWYNGSSYSFTWKQGTQLATLQKGITLTTYSYDMDGIRNAKTVGNTTYSFDTLSGHVARQSWDGKSLDFLYEDGHPYAVIYQYDANQTPLIFYYALNVQCDVVGILDSTGALCVRYSYDPWGVPTLESDTSSVNIGSVNPLRFKGYYYDTETGFYYLQSRYYDPVIGRFISADCSYASTGQGFIGCNMFAYCGNDPVNTSDPNGNRFLEDWSIKDVREVQVQNTHTKKGNGGFWTIGASYSGGVCLYGSISALIIMQGLTPKYLVLTGGVGGGFSVDKMLSVLPSLSLQLSDKIEVENIQSLSGWGADIGGNILGYGYDVNLDDCSSKMFDAGSISSSKSSLLDFHCMITYTVVIELEPHVEEKDVFERCHVMH